MKWMDEFKNPPARSRIKPFWFWNGDLAEEEITYQIKEMSDKGLGGFFICARQGQKVPYLSEEWFRKVEFAAKEASQFGLETWLYDEYPYPSGMSGGEVLLKHPEAEHMILKHRSLDLAGGGVAEINLGWCELLYAKAFPVGKNGIDFESPLDLEGLAGILQTEEFSQTTGLTKYNRKRFFSYHPERIIRMELPEGDWHVEVYAQAALGEFKYYGGYIDPCSKDAVQTFLETTHEKYDKYLGKDFGGRIIGMFSDEVGLLSPIPWSKCLPEYFSRQKGYRILECLPALHNAAYKNAYSIRYDLYDSIHKLFVESYHKQVSDWCASHHLEYATEVPSMRMSTQCNSTIVGGDTAHEKLGRSLEWIYDEYLCKYRSNAKAVSSLTRQLGKKFSMIESFHSVGWTMTLQDAKWMFDRLGASGINFYNVHAFYYTIDGMTKHDAPPSQFLQNPYWKHYRLLADYVGRLGTWITNTEADIHVAVLDPAATLWTYLGEPFNGFSYQGEDRDEGRKCDQIRKDWVAACKELLFHQIDYEHLDAEILERANICGGEILIGRASYRVLVIPPTDFIEAAAYKKIHEFAECGGRIVFLGTLPKAIIDRKQQKADWNYLGLNSRNDRRHFENIKDEAWCAWCMEAADLSFEIKAQAGTEKDIISSVREDGDARYVFLVNQGGNDTVIDVACRCFGCRYDAELCLDTGELNFADESVKEEDVVEESVKEEGVKEEGVEEESVKEEGVEEEGVEEEGEEEEGEEDESVKVEGMEGESVEDEKGVRENEKEKGHHGSQMEKVRLRPYESRLLRYSKFRMYQKEEVAKKQPGIGTARRDMPARLVIDTSKWMQVSMEGGNIFRLDDFRISRDGKNWHEVHAEAFIEQCAEQPCLNPEDLQFVSAFGIPKKIVVHYPLPVIYKSSFVVKTVPERCSLLMDGGAVKDAWRMSLNGKEINNERFQKVFVNDQNNRMADITELLVLGQNELEVAVTLTKDSDGIRDPLYLYGDFGVSDVNGGWLITEKPKTTGFDLDYIRGFPYYSGTLTFRTSLVLNAIPERFDLELDVKDGCHDCVEIILNGQSIGVRAFSPYAWHGDGTVLVPGENEVEIRLTNTLAPMLEGTWFDYKKHALVKI